MSKLLKEVYKTFEGARKRAAFENACAKGEFLRGDRAKIYRYTILPMTDGTFRVVRDNPVPEYSEKHG